MSLQVDDAGVMPLQRLHDSHIMDHVIASKRFTKGQLARINYVRLYLDVHTVSDIATACGKFLAKDHARKGRPRVNQAEPQCKRTWQLWNRACTLLCSNKRTKRLTTPLGPWTVNWHGL